MTTKNYNKNLKMTLTPLLNGLLWPWPLTSKIYPGHW